MVITQVINDYFNSNSYILSLSDKLHIIVDSGSSLPKSIKKKFPMSDKQVVFLTHEHTDHIIGLTELNEDIEVVCSEKCASNIANSKQNYSYYSENIIPFEIKNPTNVFNIEKVFSYENAKFRFIETPGHSPGSSCIFFSNGVFTGDTILNGIKSPLSFPHSSRNDYKASLSRLIALIKPGDTIYPGHGDPFVFSSGSQLVI